MDERENEFVSLQDAIALVTQEFSEGSNVTKILEAVMRAMVCDFDDISLNELEELCR